MKDRWWKENYYVARAGYHWRQQGNLDSSGKVPYLLGKIGVAIADLGQRLQRAIISNGHSRILSNQDITAIQSGYVETIRRYRPKRYDGSISLIVNERLHQRDPALGWTELVSGEIKTYEALGDHEAYIRDHVEAVAKQLKECLDETDGQI